MMDIYALIRPLLMSMDAETAHRLTIGALKMGLGSSAAYHDKSLETTLWGMTFPNPLGLAAGFDKNAEVIGPMLNMGFGFVEAGTVTPLPQPGNLRPRIFRDAVSRSVINRMGFPGSGMETFARILEKFLRNGSGIVGVNIGINKDTASPVDDYRRCIERLAPLADYIAVNISSPNTAGLRKLQGRDELSQLLSGLSCNKPLLLKVSPDLDAAARADITRLAVKHNIAGLIVSNTTVTRPTELSSAVREEKGGLSGPLLKDLSTTAIRDFYGLTDGRLPIIGVGGVSSAEEAYEKIKAGASLVQLYTGLIYQGPSVITRILKGLASLLQQDGLQHVAEAVGMESGTGKTVAKAVV